MFICICKGIDEKSLKKMHSEGVDTVAKVIASCGAGGDCGTCAFKINRILQEENQKSPELETGIAATIESPLKVSSS